MEKRHITQPPFMTPWFMLGSFFILWFWFAFGVGRLIPQWSDNWLVKWAGFVVISLGLFCLHRFLLWGDVELTERGIKCHRRIGSSFLPWSEVAQVCAIRYSSTRVLVLLKKGGRPMKSGNDHLLFFLLNPRKVVFLPDDKFTRSFVAEFYGPEDIREAKDAY